MDNRMDIVALGECLIDFLLVESRNEGKLLMEGDAGGAPANAMAMAAKLGRKTAYIGKVGNDAFGDHWLRCFGQAGVDVSAVVKGDEPTTLAMVALDETGNRSFSFYRNQTADVTLRQQEVDMGLAEGSRIFNFGTVSMTASPARETTLAVARRAKAAGARIAFDPNHRPFLWADKKAALDAMHQGMALADYVKVSEDEAFLLTGEKDPEKAAMALAAQYNFRFLAITLGPLGCMGAIPGARVLLPTYDVETVDTTGAGDAFWGAVLHRLLNEEAEDLTQDGVRDILAYGNAAGSLVTTRYGAITAQPTQAEIYRCVETGSHLRHP